MKRTAAEERRRLESLARPELERYQLNRLNALLDEVLPANSLYAQKFARMKRPVESLAEFANWPYTFKEELIGPASSGGVANNHTWPRSAIRGSIKPPAPAAIRWCCSTRWRIGNGYWNAGNMCSMERTSRPAIAR